MMRLPVAGCRLSSARCGCLGVAMRFCPGSRINRLMLIPGQKSLSRFEKTGVFRVPGQFSLPRYERQSFYVRTGTTCRSRDWRYSADSACRGMWTLKIGFVPVLKNGPKLRTGTNSCPEEGKRGSAMALGIIVVGGKFASGNNGTRPRSQE